jgi:hypothetical protein
MNDYFVNDELKEVLNAQAYRERVDSSDCGSRSFTIDSERAERGPGDRDSARHRREVTRNRSMVHTGRGSRECGGSIARFTLTKPQGIGFTEQSRVTRRESSFLHRRSYIRAHRRSSEPSLHSCVCK